MNEVDTSHRSAWRPWALIAAALVTVVVLIAVTLGASLRGSPASMREQHSMAVQHGLDFYQTSDDIRAAAERGELVRLTGDENYEVADFVAHPYAQPEAALFVERLAAQYHQTCGERLVVTSATRAIAEQPWNAHHLSVHPAGMAIDFRVSLNESCRQFIERAFMAMEERGLINGIREFRPPHYHVAIYPLPYAEYAAERIAEEEAEQRRLEQLAEMRRADVVEEENRARRLDLLATLTHSAIPPVQLIAAVFYAGVQGS